MVFNFNWKQLLLLGLFCSSFTTVLGQIKGIIAADCHGVIVKSKKWKRHQEVALFVGKHLYELPMIVKVGLKLLYKRYKHEKITMQGVFHEFPELETYREDIYNFITLQDPVDAIIKLLKRLKEEGYLLVLASNMASDTYEYNKKKCPELLDFFDFHFLASEENGSKVDDQLGCDQVFISKSKSNYFVKMREKINAYANVGNDMEILFIDDRVHNIEAANKTHFNIRGILPEELENECNALGIFLGEIE